MSNPNVSPGTRLGLINKLHAHIQGQIAGLELGLSEILGQEVSMIYQRGDGWCVLFDDSKNSPVTVKDLDEIFASTREEARAILLGNMGISPIPTIPWRIQNEEARLRGCRHYMESGCKCIGSGEIDLLDHVVPDKLALDYYYRNCKCSRHPDRSPD